MLATFGATRDAIACAIQCHEAANASGLRLHVGIHAGDVIREEGNVFGGAVNIAARSWVRKRIHLSPPAPPNLVSYYLALPDIVEPSPVAPIEKVKARLSASQTVGPQAATSTAG